MSKNNHIKNFIKIPDVISLGNALSGFLSILFAFQSQFILAALLIVLAAVFDFFDGRVARKYNMSSEFGVQLDSLCDTVSFLLAPAIFAFMVTNQSILAIVIISFFVLAGIARLARFNVTGTVEDTSRKYFEGLPVPVSLILPFLFFLFQYLGIPNYIWLTFYVIHGILMISIIKIPKL